jgi:hypothetical protein
MPRKGKGRTQPLMLDIKMRYIGPKKPTLDEVREALEYMLATGGEVPDQWQFAAMDWTRPRSGSRGFRSGSVGNFNQFAPIIRAKLDSLKVAIARRPQPDAE